MKTIFTIVVVAIFSILLLIRIRYDRLVKQIWRSLKVQPTEMIIFTQDMVADLDEPVQRYFLHGIKTGTPLVSYVELEMSGSFKRNPDGDWLPMKALQIISTSPGFVWKANVGKSLIKLSGADYYSQGKGRVKFSLWGLIPLVDAQNQDINRSSAGRLGVEYFLLPSALLPHNGVTWQAISHNTIQANFQIDDEPITLTLNIDHDGKLLKVSLPRWGDKTETGNWQYLPFGAEVQAEETFDGYTIPSKIIVGWWFGTDNYSAFFQSTIKSAWFY